MIYLALCLLVFGLAYLLNMLYTSVFYHRGLCHRAVRLRPWTRWVVISTGNWVTGIDPKTWICMHRLHHAFSDERKDPHSPRQEGALRIIWVQSKSYGKVMDELKEEKAYYTSRVKDLEFPVHWLNRNGLWFLPHLGHTLLAVALAYWFEASLLAFAYWIGIMSHPLQGWAVNALGHQYGYRNFKTPDRSTNNTMVAWLVMGEGIQNNHHHRPRSPKFSVNWWEIDTGYWLCRIARHLKLIDFRTPH